MPWTNLRKKGLFLFLVIKTKVGKIKMYYNCPNCASMKKPKIVKYFPPIIVKCLDCEYESLEEKFIRKEKSTLMATQ
jgi:hypothetical protein